MKPPYKGPREKTVIKFAWLPTRVKEKSSGDKYWIWLESYETIMYYTVLGTCYNYEEDNTIEL